MRNLSVDPGFGNYKIAEAKTSTYSIIPSVVGIGGFVDQGLLSTGIGRGHRSVKPHEVEFDGQTFLVGPNVHEYRDPITRLDYQRLSDGLESRALMYAVLGAQLDHVDEANLLIGLPVEVMQDRSVAQKTLHGLRSWLVGSHLFSVDGQPYAIEVAQVKAMSQPLGSYFALGLDENGEWRSDVDFDAPAVVVDIGFNTLDMFGIKSGKPVYRYTGGDRLGMHRACYEIQTQAMERFGARLSLYEADELIRSGGRGRIYHPGGHEDAAPIVLVALGKTFADINEFLGSRISQSTFRYLLIVGGGPMALRPLLVAEYPQAIIPANPVINNALGLARYAVSEGVF